MRLRKKLRLWVFLMILAIQVVGQEDLHFTSLNTKNGLSSNTVNVILKDRAGLMWFGTDDGLDKFDGNSFKIYRHKSDDSTSLPSNEILSLHEDRSGNLWIGTGGGSLSLYDRKRDAFSRFPVSGTGSSLKSNVIRAIHSDYLGRIWLIHLAGFDVLDPKTGSIINIPMQPGSYNIHSGLSAFEDSRHRMWIGTTNGLFRYDPATYKMKEFHHVSGDPSSLPGNTINAIKEDKPGNIWIATNDGLGCYISETDRFINYRKDGVAEKSLSGNYVDCLGVEGEKLWVGTKQGLDILDISTGRVNKYSHDVRNINSLSGQSVRSLYIDDEGIFWLGIFGGGINKYDRNLSLFNSVTSNLFDEQGLQSGWVSAFAEAGADKIYVGTGGGLSLFDQKTRLFTHFDLKPSLPGQAGYLSISSLKMNSRGQLLVGTYSNGLYLFNTITHKLQKIKSGKNEQELNSDEVYCLEMDRKGNVWVGTNGSGINVLNAENMVIRRYTSRPVHPNDIEIPNNAYIRDIKEDSKGNMWIATHGGGIVMLESASGKFKTYTTWNSQLPDDKILSMLEDKNGNIWAGTFGGGLVMFQKNSSTPVIYNEKNGLFNNTIYKILEDQQGLIWVSTNKGISSIDPVSHKVQNFSYHNGVQNNNFVQGSGLRLSGGELFFGGVEGFNYFNPSQFRKNNNVPRIVLTDLRISNQSVIPHPDGPISEHISVAREINLAYRQNFALSFVGLNYTSPEQNQYAYKLEGYDDDWNYVGNTNTASYMNLDPGEYVFRVRASNNDGVWNNDGSYIRISVRPPFWRTTYAYILYIMSFAGLLLYLRYSAIRKIKRKLALEQIKIRSEQERKEAERIHELDMLKIKFLTNLSHEFRTPISLILGPADKLLTEQKDKPWSGQLKMIKRNAKRLLNLVNQLLDFRKMEEQELKLNATEGELVTFIQETCDSFNDLSERKRIRFEFRSQIDKFYTSFDHDKIERILFNVLSNAFKFTHEGGKISLELSVAEKMDDQSVQWVIIKVSDTGIGIPAEEKEKIFERFFQHSAGSSILNQGSGIGLSITREFVRMHNGEIDVESEPGEGTSFIIRLPFTPVADQVVTDQVPEETISVQPRVIATGPTVLLVEDNEDFRLYLKENLQAYYKIIEAVDGKDGWQKILFHHPQLVVTDISMPNMDGIQLIRKIKSDKRTNHLPVILLTALTGEKDQLIGLGTGANDYITKPFNFQILNAKINNLLTLNSTLKNTYSRQIKLSAPESNIESDDEKLLKEIMAYLEENLTNSRLSVEELSKHVGMSRSTLYSKILQLTGETPVEFIRSVKLDKAAVLLRKSKKNVAQIAYSVGFSTPNYFAKAFKAKFNMLPSEYINKGNEEDAAN
jgi:signal transduction histidine kinase/ligand-binding sensor domain-containing protein/DNA-binding response OmpR family regulator